MFILSPRPDPLGLIEVQDLTKVYSAWSWRGRKTIEALRGVTAEVQAGEVFGLLGPNGAGKTTLVKILLGIIRSSSGSATLFGQPVGSAGARMRVGYLPESLRVDRHHSARSALRYYGRMSRMSHADIDRRSDELLELVGLRGRDRESVKQFSKGMYQRLGLAQALMHNPDLLVLDEPTDGLDPVGRNEVRQVIERLRESGKTIFLNSHILQEVELICSRVAIMSRGKISVVGPIDELVNSKQFETVIFEVLNDLDAPSELPFQNWLQGTFSNIVFFEQTAGNALRFSLAVTTQQEIDSVVDQIRGAGFSLCKLTPKRASLEETFMRAVESSETEVLKDSEGLF